MNGENGKNEDDFDFDDDLDDDIESPDPTDTVVMSDDSVELNVEDLMADVDVEDASARKKEVHRRLEELSEKRREEQELDSTFNFNLDDDLT
jgi:hypothetical protein